jgi:hypothetical protein
VDPTEEATDDTASPAAWTGAEACDVPPLPATPGSTVPAAETTGFCAAAAGWAKITVRTKPSMKVRARPPQAYRHARRVQVPAFDSPTLKRIGAFPSTAGKTRQALGGPQ